jgi:CTP synthase (UTP-ammonia lyase)
MKTLNEKETIKHVTQLLTEKNRFAFVTYTRSSILSAIGDLKGDKKPPKYFAKAIMSGLSNNDPMFSKALQKDFVSGIEGKIEAIRYARETKTPFLGICLGMQLASIEFARNVIGLQEAHSTEFSSKTAHPVIDLLPEQKTIEDKGRTLRLGHFPCHVKKDTKAFAAYQEETIQERHRHRYEFNNEYRQQMEQAGFIFSGTSPDERLVEIIELRDHPWFVASQFHPEFASRPNRAQPLFRDFIGASIQHKKN